MNRHFINTHQKELTDSLCLMLMQGVNQMLPIVVMPYLMKTLGANGYGQIGFALSVIQYLILIVDFGFNLSATKQIAIFKDDTFKMSQVFWNVVAAKLILMILSIAIMLLFIFFSSTFAIYKDTIFATLPMLIGNTFTFMWLFQGIGKIRNLTIINTLSKVILLPLIFFLVKSENDYIIAAFLQSIVFTGTAIISNIYLFKLNTITLQKPQKAGMIREMKSSFPLFLSSASTSIYTQLTTIILGFYCATGEIGKYAAADRIMRAMCFLLYVPINQVFFQKISYIASINKKEAFDLFRKVRSIVICIMSLVGIIIFIGCNWLPLFLGQDYNGIGAFLRILSIAPLAIGLGGVYGQMGLVAMGNKHTIIKFRNVYFISSIISIFLLFIFTPTLKGIGACIVVSLTECLVASLMFVNFKINFTQCLQ